MDPCISSNLCYLRVSCRVVGKIYIYIAEFHLLYTNQIFIYANTRLAYESHMNLSLFALKVLMTPIYYRTEFKLPSIDVKALYYLAPTYFPILIFIILSYLIQEPYALVSWTNCYSYSLDLLTLLTPLEVSFLRSLSFDGLCFSNAHQFPHKAFSFPQKELISCISQVS